MIFMAATMLAACSDGEKTQPEAGEQGYISTNGEGVDNDEMVIDRTSNTTTNTTTADTASAEEQPMAEGEAEAETRARRVMGEEQKRLAYWTLDEESITAEEAALTSNLEEMEKKWYRIEADLKNVETGTYNPAGQLSREGQKEIKEARAKVAEAKRTVQTAQQRSKAGRHEDAAEKLKAANEKLADAREDYMEALEKETGVEMEVETEQQ